MRSRRRATEAPRCGDSPSPRISAPPWPTASARQAAFLALSAEAQACTLCPAMAERTAVLSELNGSLNPLVLFVAEAPGRQGADRTRVPMSGDASGRVFRHLMAVAGLAPERVFITNAVLCNPRKETGANRAPKASEMRNCRGFLTRTIDLLNPPLVVAVGAAALKALDAIEPHGLILGLDVGRPVAWRGRALIPLYHPSPQVLISRRNLAQQEEDWQAASRALERIAADRTKARDAYFRRAASPADPA